MDKITKSFSALVMIGCKHSKQCFGLYRNKNGDTCAIGAAMLGIATAHNPFRYDIELDSLFPWLGKPCPEEAKKELGVKYKSDCWKSAIVLANDETRLPREQIAAVVRKYVEEKEECPFQKVKEAQ